MAPQLEASGAEPTLANCVQTALRILAAAPGMGSSRRPAYKGSFIHRGRRWRRRRQQRRCDTATSSLPQPALSSPSSGSGHRPWEAGSYLSRFLKLEKGGREGSSALELQSQDGLIGVLCCPPLRTYVPPPQFNNGQIPLAEEARSPQGTAGGLQPSQPDL